MAFPTNITKEHLLKAIDKIDNDGIPKDAQSVYYDMLYNGKKYPPKVVVSFANIFANGKELDRNDFSGGIDTPCFKLLEANGFIIKPKQNTTMSKIKIYEIKSGASVNAPGLLSPDGKYFYWDTAQFTNNTIGDKVFVINPTHKWALYTEIKVMDIPARYNSAERKSRFNHDNNSYEVEDSTGRYPMFIRFDIIQKISIPSEWRWTRSIGQSEIYDLWKGGETMSNPENRIEKIDDLEKLFPDGDAYDTLEETRILLQGRGQLNQDIVDAINSDLIQNLLTENEFYFSKAQDQLKAFKAFKEPTPDFFKKTFELFSHSGKTYKQFIGTIDTNSDEYRLINAIGKFIAHCDANAANKSELNDYDDKRTLAKSFVRQTDWVKSLLNYKAQNNNQDILPPSIKNAVIYIENPNEGLTLLSENHREMLVKNLLKKPYNKVSFVQDVLQFFAPYNIQPKNILNLTGIISHLLYDFPKVKKLWFDRVEGLAAIDNTGWLENAVISAVPGTKAVHWWSKVISNKNTVSKLLDVTLKENGFFYFYYLQKNHAVYRMRVLDYADINNYSEKNWNAKGDVIGYKSDMNTYRDGTQQAKIIFLSDELIKLNNPIPVENIDFYGSAPRQDNLEGYSEINWDEDQISELKIDRKVWFVTQGETYTAQRGMKFLWAPAVGQDDKPRFYWDNLLKVKKGDIIFNYSEGLKGVSIAASDGYKANNEDTTSQWGPDGFRVDINLTPLNPLIPSGQLVSKKEEFKALLESIVNKPFNTNGGVNQGYLYEFTKEAGRLIREIYGKLFGEREIDDFFDTVLAKPSTNEVNKMSTKETIQHSHKYITSKSFQYEFEEIANFYLALRAKPFVILAGISGTGKTQLPIKLAESLGFSPEQVIQLPVSPDWTDGTDLLGYTSLDGNFIPKSLTLAIDKATNDADKPYFFILDEMNLARVEHYFSDFLSVIETRKREAGVIKTNPILREEMLRSAKNKNDFSAMGWPQNLFLIGTVNMDETTHAFSRKVLDRANSIEMNEVNLDWISSNSTIAKLSGVPAAFFESTYLSSKDLSEEDKEGITSEMILLKAINKILQEADLHFAYRVRDEIAFYLIINKKEKLIDDNTAFDFQVVQKILPRIHGSSERVQNVLIGLFNCLEGTSFSPSNFEFSEFAKKVNSLNLKYRRASRKIIFMLKRFDDDRFTSFWL